MAKLTKISELKLSRNKKDLNDVTDAPLFVSFSQLLAAKKNHRKLKVSYFQNVPLVFRLDKLPTKLFLNFCPEIFCTFLGASWKLFWASCRLPCLWCYILSPQEAQKASRKLPGSYKKFQGRNPEIILLLFLSKQ